MYGIIFSFCLICMENSRENHCSTEQPSILLTIHKNRKIFSLIQLLSSTVLTYTVSKFILNCVSIIPRNHSRMSPDSFHHVLCYYIVPNIICTRCSLFFAKSRAISSNISLSVFCLCMCNSI